MSQRRDARDLLESSSLHWRRDWDALLIGFVLGVLTALVIAFGVRVVVDGEYRPVRVEDGR